MGEGDPEWVINLLNLRRDAVLGRHPGHPGCLADGPWRLVRRRDLEHEHRVHGVRCGRVRPHLNRRHVDGCRVQALAVNHSRVLRIAFVQHGGLIAVALGGRAHGRHPPVVRVHALPRVVLPGEHVLNDRMPEEHVALASRQILAKLGRVIGAVIVHHGDVVTIAWRRAGPHHAEARGRDELS